MPRCSKSAMAGRIVVGTSSWADPGFVDEWYPPGLPARDRLPYYAERFEAVEVNSTFSGAGEVASSLQPIQHAGQFRRWAQDRRASRPSGYRGHDR